MFNFLETNKKGHASRGSINLATVHPEARIWFD